MNAQPAELIYVYLKSAINRKTVDKFIKIPKNAISYIYRATYIHSYITVMLIYIYIYIIS